MEQDAGSVAVPRLTIRAACQVSIRHQIPAVNDKHNQTAEDTAGDMEAQLIIRIFFLSFCLPLSVI